MANDTLLVAEMFYSQQSEGISTGVPAFFLRLAQCNLLCGGLKGSLIKQGKATWYCDTIEVWKKGVETSFEDIYQKFVDYKIVDWLQSGRVHLIISGGEPTMDIHQNKLVQFIEWLKTRLKGRNNNNDQLYIEIETNGTNQIKPELWKYISQINCSPKLSNSGMSQKIRIKPDTIAQFKTHPNHQFKFVINTEDHLKECIGDFIIPYNLNWTEIVLMPGVDNLADLSARTREVFELGIKYGFRAITRSHILAWDKTTGV